MSTHTQTSARHAFGLYTLCDPIEQQKPYVQRRPPSWRHVELEDCFLAFSDGAWFVQTEAAMRAGSGIGVLCLEDADSPTPVSTTAVWEVAIAGPNGGWKPEPKVRCVVIDPSLLPTPRALVLHGPDDAAGDERVASCLGVYRLLPDTMANARPVWRHSVNADRHLAYTGHGWAVQPTDALGKAHAWAHLPCSCPLPTFATRAWEVEAGVSWTTRRELAVKEATPRDIPAAAALVLQGSVTESSAARCLGVYRLVPGRRVHGRPVWRHAERGHLWIGYSGKKWFVQTEAALGSSAGMLCLQTAWPPDLAGSAMWEAPSLPTTSRGGWKAQPELSCRAAAEHALTAPAALRLVFEPGSHEGGHGEDDKVELGEHRKDVDTDDLGSLLGHYSRGSTQLFGRCVWHQTCPLAVHSIVFTGAAWLVCPASDVLRVREMEGGIGSRLDELERTAKARLFSEGVCPSQGGHECVWHLMGGDGERPHAPLYGLRCLEAAPLPSASEVNLFEDDFTHTCDERTCRPGRGDGLADFAENLCLYKDISPAAVKQGGIGNCWLISVFAVVAEQPASISNLFEQCEISSEGRYNVHLFHPVRDRWEVLTVDDRIPVTCGGDECRYAGMTGSGELWPCILEKAFAKLFGSWSKLQGNSPAVSLKAMTGCTGDKLLVLSRKPQSDEWECYSPRFDALVAEEKMQMVKAGWPAEGGLSSHAATGRQRTRRSDDVHRLLDALATAKCVMCASVSGREAKASIQHRLVPDHAYSILRVVRDVAGSGKDLLQLRNPHAGYKDDWRGAWSNGSREWDANPHRLACARARATRRGIFWMELCDFARVFDTIYVCRFDDTAREKQATHERVVVPQALVLELTGREQPSAELDVSLSACLGTFQQVYGRVEQGQPVWRHAAAADCFLAFTGAGWALQREASLGRHHCHLFLPGQAMPDLSSSVCGCRALENVADGSRGRSYECGQLVSRSMFPRRCCASQVASKRRPWLRQRAASVSIVLCPGGASMAALCGGTPNVATFGSATAARSGSCRRRRRSATLPVLPLSTALSGRPSLLQVAFGRLDRRRWSCRDVAVSARDQNAQRQARKNVHPHVHWLCE